MERYTKRCHASGSGFNDLCQDTESIGRWKTGEKENECIYMTREKFDNLVLACRKEWCAGWSKEYREMDETKLLETVTEYMENWLMIQCKEEQVVIRPAAGRLAGVYPDDFKGGTKE